MDSRQSPLRLSFETAFKLNQSLYANENTNETLKKNNIKSSSIQINPHSTALSQRRIVPSQESKCISHRKIKENRPRTSSRNPDSLLSMYHINLANYIEEHKIDVKLTGTKRFSDKSGDYYLKNILFQKKGDSSRKILPQLSLKNPESLNSCINKCKKMKTLELHANSLTVRLPHDALTPIPIIDQSKVGSKCDSTALSNAERYAVHIRRLEYSKGIIKTKALKKEDMIRLGKITLIQKWWKTIFAIKRIQRVFRGWYYRRQLYSFLKSLNVLIQNLLEYENKLACYNMKYFLRKMKYIAFRNKLMLISNNNKRRQLKNTYLKWFSKVMEIELLQSENNFKKSKEINDKVLNMLFSNLTNGNNGKEDREDNNNDITDNHHLNKENNQLKINKAILIRHSKTAMLEIGNNDMKELFSLCKKFTVWKCKTSGRYITLLNALIHFKKKKNDNVSRGVNNLIELLREKLKETLLKVSVYESPPKKNNQSNKKILMVYEYKSHSANHRKRLPKDNQISYPNQYIKRSNTTSVIRHNDKIIKAINNLSRIQKYYWFNALKNQLNRTDELLVQTTLLENIEKQLSQLKNGRQLTANQMMINKKIQKVMNDLINNSGINDIEEKINNKSNNDENAIHFTDQNYVIFTFSNEGEKENNEEQDKDLLINEISTVFQDIHNEDTVNKVKKDNKSNEQIEDSSDKEDESNNDRISIRKNIKSKDNTKNNEQQYDFIEHDKKLISQPNLKSKNIKQLKNEETEKDDIQVQILNSGNQMNENKSSNFKTEVFLSKSPLNENSLEEELKQGDIGEKKDLSKYTNPIRQTKDKGKRIEFEAQIDNQYSYKESQQSIQTIEDVEDKNNDIDKSNDNSDSFQSNEEKNIRQDNNNAFKSSKNKMISRQKEDDKIDRNPRYHDDIDNKKQCLIKQKQKQKQFKADREINPVFDDKDNIENYHNDAKSLNKQSINYCNFGNIQTHKKYLTPPMDRTDTNLSELIQRMKQSQNINKNPNPDGQTNIQSSIANSNLSLTNKDNSSENKLTSLQLKSNLQFRKKLKNSIQQMKELQRNKSDIILKTNRYDNIPSPNTKTISKSHDISLNKSIKFLKEYDNYVQPDSSKYLHHKSKLGSYDNKTNSNQLERKLNNRYGYQTNEDNRINIKQINIKQKEEPIINKDKNNEEKQTDSNSNSNSGIDSKEIMENAIKTIMNKPLDKNEKVYSSNFPSKVYYPIISNLTDNKTQSSSIFMVKEEQQSPIKTHTNISKQYLKNLPHISKMILENRLKNKLNIMSNALINHNNPSFLRYYFNKWNRKLTRLNNTIIPHVIQAKSHSLKASKHVNDSVLLFIAFNQWKHNQNLYDNELQEIDTKSNNDLHGFNQLTNIIFNSKAFANTVFISQVQLISQAKILFDKWRDIVNKLRISKRLRSFRKKYKFVKVFSFNMNQQYTVKQNIILDYFFKWKYSPSNIYCACVLNRKINCINSTKRMIKHYPNITELCLSNAFGKWKIKPNMKHNKNTIDPSRSFRQLNITNLSKNFHLIKRYSQFSGLNNKERVKSQFNFLIIKDKLLYRLFLNNNIDRLNILRGCFGIWSKNKAIRKNKLKANRIEQSTLLIVKNVKSNALKKIQKYFFKWIEYTISPIKEHILLNTIISYQKIKANIVKGRNELCDLILRRKFTHWSCVSAEIKKIFLSAIQVIKRHSSRFLIQSLKKNKDVDIMGYNLNLWKEDMVYHKIRASLIHSKKTNLHLNSIIKLYVKCNIRQYLLLWHDISTLCTLIESKMKSMSKVYFKCNLKPYITKWHNISTQCLLKTSKLQQYLMKNNRLLEIERLFTVWKRQSFSPMKTYVQMKLIKKLAMSQKQATKPQRSIKLFFNKIKSLNKKNKLLKSLFKKQYFASITYAFSKWEKYIKTFKIISFIKDLGLSYMKRKYINTMKSFSQIINKKALLNKATLKLKQHTIKRFFGKESRNIIKARRLSFILNHIYESKSFFKWRNKIILQKRQRISSFIHYVEKTKKSQALKKLRYYSLKNTILKSTTLLLGALSKYPFSVLKDHLQSIHDRGFNQTIAKQSKKDSLYLESIQRLKKEMNIDENRENTVCKSSTIKKPKIKNEKSKKDKISKDQLSKSILEEKINEDIPKNISTDEIPLNIMDDGIPTDIIMNDNMTQDDKFKFEILKNMHLMNKRNSCFNNNEFSKYHDWYSLVHSNYLKENEEVANPSTEKSNELDDLLKSKQLKAFNYDILTSNDVVDKTNNNRASESLKSYTDYLFQLSNQLDDYQQNSNNNNESNQSNSLNPEKAKLTASISTIKKETKKTPKKSNVLLLFKKKIIINANKKYLFNLSVASKKIGEFSDLCYLTKITFLHKNYKKLALLKKLIVRWKQIIRKSQITNKEKDIVYQNMDKLHKKDIKEIFSNDPNSYQSQIKKSLNNFTYFPILEEKDFISSKNKSSFISKKDKSE